MNLNLIPRHIIFLTCLETVSSLFTPNTIEKRISESSICRLKPFRREKVVPKALFVLSC